MKRKSVLQFGAALLSVSLVIPSVNGIAVQVVLAEELSVVEGEDGFTSTMPEDIDNSDVTDIPEAQEPTEIIVTPEEKAAEIEIALPQKNISVPITEFLPVQEEENTRLLNLYDGVYLLHIKNDSPIFYTFSFNQTLNESNLTLYRFDSEKNTVDSEPVQDVMHLDESGSTLSLDLNSASDYVLVIASVENVTGLGYTSKIKLPAPQEMENGSALVEETVPSAETDAQAEDILDGEDGSVEADFSTEEDTEAVGQDKPLEEEKGEVSETVAEPEQETEEANEPECEEPALTSVRLTVDQDLETVPIAFLDYLDDLDAYSLTLIYSDGSEQVFDEADERYNLSVDYTDESDSSETVCRTYHAVVKDISTGESFEDTQSIEFGKKDPTEIKTEEMTTVILEGKKKWVMVQSVPNITGRYAMNSNTIIDKIYYAFDDNEVVCAEDAFDLQQGVMYKFLIKLK